MMLVLCVLALPQAVFAADSFLSPMGPVAADQRAHLIRVTAITMIAIVPVLIATPLILWRYHRVHGRGSYDPGHAYRPDWEFSGPLEIVLWGIPCAIVAVLGWWLWHETDRLDPYRARGPDPVQIQAIGLDWKWLFLYPDRGIATLDRLVIPVDRPVRLSLTTDSVMQSFRISALAGQIYAMPGMRTELNFSASRPGSTTGRNTQYNGEGFPQQHFAVTALRAEDWQAWLDAAPTQRLDPATYEILTRRAGPEATRDLLGLNKGEAAGFDLAVPDLFDRVIARYHRGAPVLPGGQLDAQSAMPVHAEGGGHGG